MSWFKPLSGLKTLVSTANQLLQEEPEEGVVSPADNSKGVTSAKLPEANSTSEPAPVASSPAPSSSSLEATAPPKPKQPEREYKVSAKIREYVMEICKHPETFTKFPLDLYVDKKDVRKWELNPKQEEHAKTILNEVHELRQLRYTLCPSRMNDAQFWHIYFLLLKNTGVDFGEGIFRRDNARDQKQSVDDELEHMWELQISALANKNGPTSRDQDLSIDDGIDPADDSYFSTRSTEISNLTLSFSKPEKDYEDKVVSTKNVLSPLSAPPSPAK